MTIGAQTSEGRFVEVSWGFHGILIGSRVLLPSRWTMLEKIPGDVASWCWPGLVAKSSHTGLIWMG
jgi:hypothetical protein